MTPVEAVLEQIRQVASDEHDKGTRFERLVLHALQTDRTFSSQFVKVWMWNDWPGRTGVDIGIDLVAMADDGSLTAIQCKCYAPDRTLTKEDIDSFLATSAQQQWARRIVVSTTDLWSHNAEQSLIGQAVPVERIGIDVLDSMTVDWSSYDVLNPSGLRSTARHELRPHQVQALDAVRSGFEAHDRGKLIMACGTGKTFTALRIAEEHAGAGKTVLFLAPSIALVAQSLKEWTGECAVPIRPFAVCSDATAANHLGGENATTHDVVVPPTTDPAALIGAGVATPPDDKLTVVFSTYQSSAVIADVQAKTGLVFDLVICDEAHRTAGVTTEHGEDKAFRSVLDDSIIPAHKRLFMTATPKLFKPVAVEAAREQDVEVASMDDESKYGPEFFRLGFGDAVEQGLLADYRVLILTVDEQAISEAFQELLSTDGALKLPNVAKFVGCLRALAKIPADDGTGFAPGESPMQRAVAFWSTIDASEKFAQQFETVADAYFDQLEAADDDSDVRLAVPTRHVDGKTKISSRRADIRWLKATPPPDECRVLTNAKCLTEGVDVPALDAIMFLEPRRSRIDIVQAVGRVMRKPPGKQMGYVILPIAVSAGLDPSRALDNNPDYDVVWEVLQALRAHDERFNAFINRIALSSQRPGANPDDPVQHLHTGRENSEVNVQERLFGYAEWSEAIYAKIVQKVGTRTYWEDWAREVAGIAASVETRIGTILDVEPEAASAFGEFLDELHAALNDSVTRDDAARMLAQHVITRPIFAALFGNDEFALANPVSQAMSRMVEVLDRYSLETETDRLSAFYASIRRRLEGIHPDDAEARQRVIKDLYGRFFKIAFPKVADALGIVYTPIEVVDFIIRATQAALIEHFGGTTLSDPGVHILDPFTGTGTFITRLLQSGFIRDEDLTRKFDSELHANELLLLAYYIAAVNIEMTYRQQFSATFGTDSGYRPFPGIVLTDTFQLGESGEGSGRHDVFPINNDRVDRQRKLDIRVIIGNPPYSAGQDSANDNNANLKYPVLDGSIAATYAKRSTATLLNSLYDSYVRAIRWASNRLASSPDGGVVAYVTNGGYIDSNAADGIRLSLADEFHHLYIFNLRGNQRTAGETSRREGGKIFDAGSRATVAIGLFVKQPGPVPPGGAVLHYRDIGDYLNRDEKLRILEAGLVDDVPSLGSIDWTTIQPNQHGDWINQRSDDFNRHVPAHSTTEPSIFEVRSRGLLTSRDAWNYNSSKAELDRNVTRMIAHYNAEVAKFAALNPAPTGTLKARAEAAKRIVDLDSAKFSWDRGNFTDIARGRVYGSEDRLVTTATYRPFHRRWVEAGRALNNTVYQLPRIYPDFETENLTIGVLDPGAAAEFSVLGASETPDDKLVGAGNAMQAFPQYLHDAVPADSPQADLFSDTATAGGRRHNVTDFALNLFQKLDPDITRDDIFFYVYGVLHSAEYRRVYAADLKKSLPRIPMAPTAEVFAAFSAAGRQLIELHTGYESLDPWPGLTYEHRATFDSADPESYRVTKMKHPKIEDPLDPRGRKIDDRTRIVFNEHVTIGEIPVRAYEYELGSRSAIAWVIESNRIKVDKASGIRNDPNDWATEHNKPTYLLDLVGQVVTVSMCTLDIVDSLPSLDL